MKKKELELIRSGGKLSPRPSPGVGFRRFCWLMAGSCKLRKRQVTAAVRGCGTAGGTDTTDRRGQLASLAGWERLAELGSVGT